MNERVGTVQKTQALELLSDALGQGYLDMAEFDQRARLVASARTTGELVGQFADLPSQFRWDPRKYSVSVVSAKVKSSTVNVTSILSLAFGVGSILFAPCFGLGGIIGIAAVLLGVPGLQNPGNRKKSIFGSILGCLGVAISAGVIIYLVYG